MESNDDSLKHRNGHVNGVEKKLGKDSDINDFVPIQKPGRVVCRGRFTDIVHLYAETGYLIWIEPKSYMKILFTYGDTNCDFLCYLEPEVPGVSISYLEPAVIKPNLDLDDDNYRPIQIHTGFASSSTGSVGTRHSCLRSILNPFSYAVDSHCGQCLIELWALNPKQMREIEEPVLRPFKLNFNLVL